MVTVVSSRVCVVVIAAGVTYTVPFTVRVDASKVVVCVMKLVSFTVRVDASKVAVVVVG